MLRVAAMRAAAVNRKQSQNDTPENLLLYTANHRNGGPGGKGPLDLFATQHNSYKPPQRSAQTP